MTGDDFITKLRTRLADLDDTSFSDTEILEYINQGCADLAYVGCFQYKETIAISGATSADLSTALTYNHIVVPHIEIDTVPLDYAPLYERVSFSTDSGTPTAWTYWGDLIYFNATYTGNVEIWYTYTPEPNTLTATEIPLAERWISGLLAYCEFRCRAQESDPDAIAAENEYKEIKATAQTVNSSMLSRGGVI